MKIINSIIEYGVLQGNSLARIAIHILMTLERKESCVRGIQGIGREFKRYLKLL